jgi:hypothetical protein
MEWDLKTKMIQLGNVKDESPQSKEEYQKFVLEHISQFDTQSWDMFMELTHINIESMRGDSGFWEKVYPHLKDIDCNDERFGWRVGMRIAMVQTICEDYLNLV